MLTSAKTKSKPFKLRDTLVTVSFTTFIAKEYHVISCEGFWSSGQRLEDSSYVQGKGLAGTAEVLPEYICGGSHRQQRASFMKARRRPRRPRTEVVPSSHTGAQTAKKKKPGSRLNKDLPGEGSRLSGTGGSKGKHANRYEWVKLGSWFCR